MENPTDLISLHYPLDIDDRTMTKEIMKPFQYLTSIPGKKVRQNLLKVLGYWLTVPKDKMHAVDSIIHYIHNSSLLLSWRLDDIQDNSNLRRGVPTAHAVYGIPRTAFAVNWIVACVMDLLDTINDSQIPVMYAQIMVQMFAGQGMELYWRDNSICPTEAEYLQMVYRKTGLVFVLIARTMSVCSVEKQVDIEKLLATLGVYFQINDDYQNLCSQIYYDSKGFCEDITEGKFSFPIVHAINNFPEEGKRIKDILDLRTDDIENKKDCLSILEKCGSFEYTKNKLEELKVIIYQEMYKLDANPLFKEFLEQGMLVCL